MKPPPFEYYAPDSIEECVALKAEVGRGGMFLAGGQSLVPLLSQRLVQPEAVIDLNKIEFLQHITITAGGAVRIGAMARQRAVAEHPGLRRKCPLLFWTIPSVGNAGTRNRGTLGGSLAYADPCAQLPAVALAGQAVATVAGVDGTRSIAVADLYAAPFGNTLLSDEVLVDVSFPAVPRGAVAAWQECRTREFDFPRVGVGVIVARDDDQRVSYARLVATGAAEQYTVLDAAAAFLIGRVLDDDAVTAAAESADATPCWEPVPGAADYISVVLRTLTRRALVQVRGRLDGE